LPAELQEVASAVRILSRGLTRNRQLAGVRYMDDPQLLGGYLLFYWPVSYAQTRLALNEAPGKLGSVLDLGAGPGPVSFACLDAQAAAVTAADRSSSALAWLRQLAGEAGEAIALRTWNPLRDSIPDGSYNLITMGHLLNELWPNAEDAIDRRTQLIEQVFSSLKANGSLLLIEPALRETSRSLLQVRDLLVARGYSLRSPCLFTGPCPALEKESDWCHAERNWNPPLLIQTIAKAAGLHKEALKMTYFWIASKGSTIPAYPGEIFRIVSEPLASKGRQRFIGCGKNGRIGLSLQEKHLTAGNAVFSRLARGEVISVVGTEPRGDGLCLTPQSQVRVVARAGQPIPNKISIEH
jgi:SAM-dependent methyltransferase